MEQYLNIFIDDDYPYFLDKYLKTITLLRIKYVTQFCGCDYTKIYNPKFLYTRYSHSLVVAHMVWHFTHDKKETIAALLHDVGTPCFAHSIDYVFGDYMNQESSEVKITDIIKEAEELLEYLKSDGITLDELDDFEKYPILENSSPRLCADRLDGVLHTGYIWLNTNTLSEVKEVYDNMTVLINEDGKNEIGFKDLDIALKFSQMVSTYAKELQGNKDKYIMKYVSEVVKKAVKNNLITLEDLYSKKEEDIVNIFAMNIPSWKKFNEAETVIGTTSIPDNFYISFDTKKRNTIPLVRVGNKSARITDISSSARSLYDEIDNYRDYKYAYVKTIKRV